MTHLRCLVLPVMLLVTVPQLGLAAQTVDDLQAQVFHTDEVDLFYRMGGSGPPLLMLHGMTGVGLEWDRFLPELMTSHTVIVPDLRGHGRSTNPSELFTFPAVVDDLLQLLAYLEISEVRAIGYSVGAVTLLHMALTAPERISAMVLVAGGHRVSPERRQQLREAPAFEDRSEADRDWYLQFHPRGVDQVRSLLAQRRALANNYIDLSDADLARIDVPVLLVWGADDQSSFAMPIPIELQRALPDAELWLVPGQGHSMLWPEWGGSARVARLFPTVAVEFFGDSVARR